MKRLPIGKQDFGSLIEDGYLYVDKTEYIFRLLQSGPYLFFSRPRRFGKSLLISTLKALFEGRQDLFQGLWIETRLKWEPKPVVHLDFNQLDFRSRPLADALSAALDQSAAIYRIHLKETTYKEKFLELIHALSRQGQKAVVLIDEYDKAITDFLGEEKDRILEHVNILKNFYSALKSLDAHLLFVFITGVSKYGKVSIFSDLNNLQDISLHRGFAGLCGYTQEELEHYFADRLEQTANHLGVSLPYLLDQIKNYYNGYSWDGLLRVYNPFSVLNFFAAGGEFRNYWFSTGTPTFLTRLLKEQQLASYQLDSFNASDFLLESADVNELGFPALMFQTGYFTIQSVRRGLSAPTYQLSFPNLEVRQTFLQYLLAEYVQRPVDVTDFTLIQQLRQFLQARDLEGFFQIISSVFASIPYQITRTEESYFHTIVHLCLTLSGFLVHSEVATNKGRMDALLDTGDYWYLFEFKLDQPAAKALEQIREKGYPERLLSSRKPGVLVGVSFSSAEKNIAEWVAGEMG